MKEPEFKVSVIVPVYNAAAFVRQAVASAVNMDEVGEIILIEDGSPDNALEICRQLENEYQKVRLIQHPNAGNRGPGESRNLGIRNANFDFISFLDADDYYLPNRFITDKKMFSDLRIDGTYNAAAYLIDSDYAFTFVSNRFKTPSPEKYVYTVREEIPPEDLFYHLLNGGKGHFHTNTVTLKKELFKKTGLFSNLKLHQDNHMWLRAALMGKLVRSEPQNPTAMIRVHENNRIKAVSRESVTTYYLTLYNDLSKTITSKKEYSLLIKKLIASKSRIFKDRLFNSPIIVFNMVMHFISHPKDLCKVNLYIVR